MLKRLRQNHTWRCRPGHKICVLDRGRVRFDIPSRWLMIPDDKTGALMMHDRKPGVESCDLGVSVFPFASEDAPGLPLDHLLLSSLGEREGLTWQSEVHTLQRGDLDLRWLEQHFVEQKHKRNARYRSALCRGGDCHVLITMSYWESRAATVEPVWDEVMRTLVLGIYVSDPARGPTVH
jgi:hypothetical protein